LNLEIVGVCVWRWHRYREHALDSLQTAQEESLVELLELVTRHGVVAVDGLSVGLSFDVDLGLLGVGQLTLHLQADGKAEVRTGRVQTWPGTTAQDKKERNVFDSNTSW
jgi:hypothetical protein